jgi:5,10-methenyltetrahydrofolate synthetase
MMSQNQITERKRKLRADMKQKRDGINQEERKRWSGAICRNLQNQPAFRKAETVCFYYPLGSEVNLLPLAQTTLDLGKQVAFPRVEGSEMAFYRVLSLEGFAQGAFHVLEPVSSARVCEPEMLVFVPGLAFDEQGSRMGYGKGYYDRYFAKVSHCLKIGVCYKMQLVAQVPCEDCDIHMDAVVTEQDCSASGRTEKSGLWRRSL